MQLKLLLGTSRAGVSRISARVTKYALEREFHDHNELYCDVECWRLYETTVSQAVYVMWAFGSALQNTVVRDIDKTWTKSSLQRKDNLVSRAFPLKNGF